MPLSLEDRIAVQDLIARYVQYIDAAEPDVVGYANLFAPDGISENAKGQRRGREEILKWVSELARQKRIGGDPPRMRHILGLPIIEGDGDRCTARTYVMIPIISNERVVNVPLVGTYVDDIVKIDGEWKFAKRRSQMDLIAAVGGPDDYAIE